MNNFTQHQLRLAASITAMSIFLISISARGVICHIMRLELMELILANSFESQSCKDYKQFCI
jgi:hypothetical protein